MTARAAHRLQSIDALRGLVIGLMLLDHVRETFFLHLQVSDPMSVSETAPGLFFSRLLAHLCAPVFIVLAGMSVWLYARRQPHPRRAACFFLLTRGLFLALLEVTLVNLAWTFQFPPQVIYLQVIWAIGLSMMALALLLWLPRPLLLLLGLGLIAGHNLLDAIAFAPEHWLHVPWAILHDRGWLHLGESLRLRTSYLVLPWIGVIVTGYALAPWLFSDHTPAHTRQLRLALGGLSALLLFVLLRCWDGYGDQPMQAADSTLKWVMSALNVTKYPPSLLFLALTLGLGAWLLLAFERLGYHVPGHWLLRVLSALGAAPMFFYLLHLYVLKFLYLAALEVFGPNRGAYFGFDSIAVLWLLSVLLLALLYPATAAFARFKARRRDLGWLRYF